VAGPPSPSVPLETDAQLPVVTIAGAIGYPVLRDRDVDQASPLRPPVIWPRSSTARMPSINAGARVAPITNKFTTTTVCDAKKSCPEEGLGPRFRDA
jgi:hypothetical protein